MKNILSFFVIVISIMRMYPETTNPTAEYKFTTGMHLNTEYIQTRMFNELEKESTQNLQHGVKTWGIGITPFSFLDIDIGSVTYSGIWSRFNNPSPSKISPLKNPYSAQNRFNIALPSRTTSKRTPSVSLHIGFPFLSVSAFSSLNLHQEPFAGAGIGIPFVIQNDSIKSPLKGNWALAWRTVSMQAKTDDSWFLEQPYYNIDLFHGLIQEFSLQSNSFTFLSGAGISFMPYGHPTGFFRLEYSLNIQPFLLNMQVFLCDINYLGQNGSYQKDTVQLSINPQIRHTFYGSIIRAVKFGLTSKFELQNGTDFFHSKDWIAFFDAGAQIDLLFFSFIQTLSFYDISVQHLTTEPIQENSSINLQTKILYYPWYFRNIERIWTITGGYEKNLSNNDETGDTILKSNVMVYIPNPVLHNLKLTLSFQVHFQIKESILDTPMLFGAKLHTALLTSFFEKKQALYLNAQTYIDVSNNLVHDIKSEFSFTFEL